MCAKVVEQVSHTWEALIDDADLENITENFHTVETKETQLKDEMNKFPLAEKMAKAIEMKKLQQQIVVLRTQ